MKRYALILSIISFMLICCITINLPSTTAASTSITSEKIDKELLDIIQSSKASDAIPVSIWFYDIDTEEIENDVKVAIKINKKSFADNISPTTYTNDTKDKYTHAQVDEYIETERQLYSEKQIEKHNAFIKKYNWLQPAKKSSTNDKIVFSSKYAPMIIANLTATEILELSKDTSIQAIYYSLNEENVDNISLGASVTEANYVRDTLGYTGSGIKIGMIESYLPDASYQYFNSQSVVYDPNSLNVYNEHATLVASILIGKPITINGVTYKGIVPDATLYATCYYTNNQWYERTEWLLSQGVHVINMSSGSFRTSANYDVRERWLDHIAINHSVHFVIAAGNAGNFDGSIYSPALAYNVITVGNVSDNNTIDHSDDTLYYDSCFVESNGTNKPDLVAPGTDIAYVVNSGTGTSYSAPYVTGIVAQLCQRNPSLKTKQDAMKAILTASISHSNLSYTPSDSEYDRYGAGMVNARSALYTSDNSRYLSSNFVANAMAGTRNYYNLNVTSADTKIRVSLTWLKHSVLSGVHPTATPEDTTLADLALTIYDPNGNFLMCSITDKNNTEIVEFEPTMTGTYQIMVTVLSSSPKTIYYGLAWW